jgi:hypothetical protein
MTRMESWMRLAMSVALLLGASTAGAGQLHIEEFGVKEVHDSGGWVAAGKVLAVRREKRVWELDVQVDRVWEGGEPNAPAIGSKQTFKFSADVEWTDPGKSPIERRLRGGARTATVGKRAVVVPSGDGGVEVLPATDAVIRRLDIVWAADPAARIAKEPEAVLRECLADPDLAALAGAELAKRGKLDTRILLRGDGAFTYARFRAMSLTEQERFVREATELAWGDREVRERLTEVVWREPVRALVPGLYPLVELYRFGTKGDERWIEEIRLQLVILDDDPAPLDLNPYVEFLEMTIRFRPSHRSDDDDFPKLTARLDAVHKQQLAALLIQNASRGSHANKDDKYDSWMLWEGVRLVEEAPSPGVVPLLARLDPTGPRVTSVKEGIMNAILTIGTAVARAHAGERDRVRAIVDGWLGQGAPSDQTLVDAYRKVVGLAGSGRR